jgi:hypothetical protein
MVNIKTELANTEWDGVGWIGLHQGKETWRALVKATMKLRLLKML